MCLTLRSTVNLNSSAIGLFERLCLMDEDVGISEMEFACGRVCVWSGRDKVVNVGKAGA